VVRPDTVTMVALVASAQYNCSPVVYLCTCVPVYLSTCLPVYLCTCLPVYLSTFVPV